VSASANFEAFLGRHARVGIDTSPFIYHLHDHATYTPLTSLLFDAIEAGRLESVTSTVSMLELLVRPIRIGALEVVDAIYGLAGRYPDLAWVALTLPIAEHAAQLRARYDFKTPDAIQVATALHAGASGFVTNDRRLSRVSELDVFVLDDALPGAGRT
jgi:predicted nucleic acid-binding protein